MIRGVDASSLVSWGLPGLSFGFARCQRQYGQADDAFVANMQRMHDAGIIGGGYEFALPMKDASGALLTSLPDPAARARASWSYFTKAALQPTDLFALDLEISPVGQDETNAWAKAWFDEWSRVADRPPGIYLGSGYLTNRTGLGLREHGFAWLWYARPIYTGWVGDQWPSSFNPPLPKDRNGVSVSWADSAWGQPPEFWQFAFGNTYDGNVYNGTIDQLRSINDVRSSSMLGLRLGDVGDAVKALQIFLKGLGFLTSTTGVYDAATSAAVLAMRQAQGSAATSGDVIDSWAYVQLLRSVMAQYAGVDGADGKDGAPGPAGPQGDVGPQGPAGPTPTKVAISLSGDVTEVI